MTSNQNLPTPLVVMASAAVGATIAIGIQKILSSKKTSSPETDHSLARGIVWASIGGAMNAAMVYTGDKLKLYESMRELCEKPNSYVTAIDLAKHTGMNQRWLREWMAQQAGMGILTLLPDSDGDDDASLHYRLPKATAEVLADPSSKQYDIAMIQLVPSLVNRARTMLPEAFATGLGRPYDEPDVAEGIDRQHTKHVRDYFIPTLLKDVNRGEILKQLQSGIQVADLGCGAGVMLVALAKAFPNSTFHGYEISTVALEKAAHNIGRAKLSNVKLHDCNVDGEQLKDHTSRYDLCVTYDVLHDSSHPMDLIRQVKVGLKKETGVWLLADIPSQPTVRENLSSFGSGVSNYYALSVCLCMSCALSQPGGAGLGTLGFSIPVAQKMLKEGGFEHVEIVCESQDNTRWFLVK